jgi:hypothetical protein
MRSMKWLLVPALILTSVVACADLRTSPGSANAADDRDEGFGDFGYSDVYRYYGGPSAVSQENEVERREGQGRYATERK